MDEKTLTAVSTSLALFQYNSMLSSCYWNSRRRLRASKKISAAGEGKGGSYRTGTMESIKHRIKEGIVRRILKS